MLKAWADSLASFAFHLCRKCSLFVTFWTASQFWKHANPNRLMLKTPERVITKRLMIVRVSCMFTYLPKSVFMRKFERLSKNVKRA